MHKQHGPVPKNTHAYDESIRKTRLWQIACIIMKSPPKKWQMTCTKASYMMCVVTFYRSTVGLKARIFFLVFMMTYRHMGRFFGARSQNDHLGSQVRRWGSYLLCWWVMMHECAWNWHFLLLQNMPQWAALLLLWIFVHFLQSTHWITLVKLIFAELKSKAS